MAQRRLLTTGKAAAALDVDQATLWRWRQSGRVTPAWVTPGGHARWDLADLRRQLGMTDGGDGMDGVEDRRPVVAAVVTSQLGVLLGQRRDGTPPWTLIAGEMMPGESPADTAVREVKEETGLRVTAGAEIGQRPHPKTGRWMIYLACRPAADTAVTLADDYELSAVRWAPLSDALALLPGLYEPVRDHLASELAE